MTVLIFLLSCSENDNDDPLLVDSENDHSAIECEDQSVYECSEDCTLIYGFPEVYDVEDNSCIDWSVEPLPAGCSSYDSSEAVISFAEDTDGICWAFSSGSFPQNWSECGPVDECQ